MMHNERRVRKRQLFCLIFISRLSIIGEREEPDMLPNKTNSSGFWYIPFFLLIILLTACSTTNAPSSESQALRTPTSTPSSTITGPTNPGLKNCQPASPIDNSSVGPETHGTGMNAELWALLMST